MHYRPTDGQTNAPRERQPNKQTDQPTIIQIFSFLDMHRFCCKYINIHNIRNNLLLSAAVSGTSLAHIWADFPGKYASGADYDGYLYEPSGSSPTSLDACKSLCEAKPTCHAVDFYMDNVCVSYATLIPHDQLEDEDSTTHSSKGKEKGKVCFSIKKRVVR